MCSCIRRLIYNFGGRKLNTTARNVEKNEYKLDWAKLQITRSCNLSCRYCSQANWKDRNTINVAMFKKQVLDRASMRLLIITGGEPLCVFDELLEITQYCKNKNMEIGIFSNATLIDRNKAHILYEDGVDWVRTSINGHNAKIHELSYPHGAFSKTMAGISNLMEQGIMVKARSTISKSNLDYIEQIVDHVESLGIQELDFRPYLLLGDCNPHESFALSRDEMLKALSVLTYLQKTKQNIQIKLLPNWFDFIFRDFFADTIKYPIEECHCGKQYIYVDAMGNYRACAGHNQLLGNYQDKSVDEIWNKSRFLSRIRNYSQPEYCIKCPYHIQCHRSNCHLINYEIDNSFEDVNKTCLLYLTDPNDSVIANEKLREDFISCYNYLNSGKDLISRNKCFKES